MRVVTIGFVKYKGWGPKLFVLEILRQKLMWDIPTIYEDYLDYVKSGPKNGDKKNKTSRSMALSKSESKH